MRNHVPLMGPFPTNPEPDMRDLQYRGPAGNVAWPTRLRGEGMRRLPQRRDTQAAPHPRPGTVFTPFWMAAIAWGPNREMHRQVLDKGVKPAHPSAGKLVGFGGPSELLGSEVRTATCRYQGARRV